LTPPSAPKKSIHFVSIRLNLCSSLDRFPKTIAISFFRRFLTDKSWRVQQAVLGIALRHQYTELIPDVQARLKTESKPDRRRNLRETIEWLQSKSFKLDGLKVRQHANGDIEAA